LPVTPTGQPSNRCHYLQAVSELRATAAVVWAELQAAPECGWNKRPLPHCLDGCDLLQNGCHKVCLMGLLIQDFSKNPVMFLDKTHSRPFKAILQV